jgi:hypothetical protein
MKLKPKEFQVIPTVNGNILLESRSTEKQVFSMELDKESFELLTLAIFQTLLTAPQNHPFFELRQLLSVTSSLGVELHSPIEHKQLVDLQEQIDLALSLYKPNLIQ